MKAVSVLFDIIGDETRVNTNTLSNSQKLETPRTGENKNEMKG